jgi:hypothetical protein
MGGDDNRLAMHLETFAAGANPPIVIHTGQHVVYGVNPLSWFFQQPDSQNAINSGQYQVFILQGADREPVDTKDDFDQAVRDYYHAVTAHGGRIILFMTWDFQSENGTDFFQNLSTAYEEIGRELNVPVIPMGLIYDDMNKEPYGSYGVYSYWFHFDDLHENDFGMAANVYATFSMLTGINPGPRPITTLSDVTDPSLLQYLSEKSWARVAPVLGR